MITEKKVYQLSKTKDGLSDQEAGFNFARNYITYPPHHIIDRGIYDSQEHANMRTIALFDYYSKNVPNEIITDIIGPITKNQPVTLYSLFASLNLEKEEEITSWCNYFGFPDGTVKFNSTTNLRSYPLDAFKTHVQDLRNVINLLNALQTDPSSIEPILDTIAEQNQFISLPGLIYGYKTNIDELKFDAAYIMDYSYQKKTFSLDSIAMQYIESVLFYYLNQISPCVYFNYSKENTPQLAWTSGPMLSQLYFMLALDMTAGKHPRSCMNSKCGRYFVPSRPKAIYCSAICKERAKQHRHYMRLKA